MLMVSFDTNREADDETYGPETEAQKGQFTLKHNVPFQIVCGEKNAVQSSR